MEPFGWYVVFVWLLGLTPLAAPGSTPEAEAGLQVAAPSISSLEDSAFMATEGTCDALWASWPQVNERAIADGTVMIWRIKTSVGNMMRALTYILPLVHFLEVGLIIDFELFPALRVAFEPALIKWDLDPGPFLERALEIEKGTDPGSHHAVKFKDGLLILNDSQLERFAARMRVEGTGHEEIKRKFSEERGTKLKKYLPLAKLEPSPPCAWNMLFRRSPSMMASMDAHSPWDTTWNTFGPQRRYNAWHIRTSDGESEASFSGNHYIFDGQKSADVCPLFLSTMDIVKDACPALVSSGDTNDVQPVYISSNSKSMARNCSIFAGDHDVEAGFVDLGIDARDSHTAFSKNPNTTVNAFIDFLQLMDASVVICTGSSFSGAIMHMKGYRCVELDLGKLPVKDLYMCLPPVC
ncbi:unnamed protein product [Scytosiphon promiscuus]